MNKNANEECSDDRSIKDKLVICAHHRVK